MRLVFLRLFEYFRVFMLIKRVSLKPIYLATEKKERWTCFRQVISHSLLFIQILYSIHPRVLLYLFNKNVPTLCNAFGNQFICTQDEAIHYTPVSFPHVCLLARSLVQIPQMTSIYQQRYGISVILRIHISGAATLLPWRVFGTVFTQRIPIFYDRTWKWHTSLISVY